MRRLSFSLGASSAGIATGSMDTSSCFMPRRSPVTSRLGLYVGHLHVKSGSARLEHEEHDAITLQAGTYRVRRQRRLEPTDADIVED